MIKNMNYSMEDFPPIENLSIVDKISKSTSVFKKDGHVKDPHHANEVHKHIIRVPQEKENNEWGGVEGDGRLDMLDDAQIVFQKISRVNGVINRMTKKAIVEKLAQHNLNTKGQKHIVKKRLKIFYQAKKLTSCKIPNPQSQKVHYDYFVVIDFEATCLEVKDPSFRPEIIEFPAVLVCSKTLSIIDEFSEYCRPQLNPKLSEFCTALTGIDQSVTDNSETFVTVLEHFEAWLKKHHLGAKYSYVVVTDGPFDMQTFLVSQCQISNVPYPSFATKWINIKKSFANFYETKSAPLLTMLELAGLKFEGQHHCGLHDARNISRLLVHLMKDGATLYANEHINLLHDKNGRLTGATYGRINRP